MQLEKSLTVASSASVLQCFSPSVLYPQSNPAPASSPYLLRPASSCNTAFPCSSRARFSRPAAPRFRSSVQKQRATRRGKPGCENGRLFRQLLAWEEVETETPLACSNPTHSIHTLPQSLLSVCTDHIHPSVHPSIHPLDGKPMAELQHQGLGPMASSDSNLCAPADCPSVTSVQRPDPLVSLAIRVSAVSVSTADH
jgi:hypothetical protein